MRLQNIYKSDINRDIRGVIIVGQDDENYVVQELTEYIITKELRSHFTTFLDNYEHSIEHPTNKIGVWISGFFGSGKSHFLKILSYLLSNKTVGGKKAVEYFRDKFDDPLMFAQLERCVKVPTETILFNIDSKSPQDKDKTVILRIFAKVFYEHLGFYGSNLKVARLEQFIAKSGKTEQFQKAFERINGGTWESSRDSFGFFEDDIVEAMMETLGMSETSARNWFNGKESDLSIEQLVKEIKEYIDSKGKDFRLLFMVDEIGQYIGSDSDLMLNLQTIVEEIGMKCEGRVWVMVTSQEAIDSITKISGNDFSKIQGRFNTRLSLSSSSVDEVIKKRILAKTDEAKELLKQQYEKNDQVLRNLFTFNNSVLDLKGYSGEGEFVDTYPFVPYQFRLMQNVFSEIRKHGNSGKHLSAGERSMLSGFQEAAQAIEDKDEYALVPFYLFYDTVHTFLDSSIRRVIDRCQDAADNHYGIEKYDVEVLKLLYLIRYIDDIKANVDNISVLMADDIRTNKIELKQKIQQSLDRLVSQNYVSRAGDTYTFLTNDEQDIARKIRNTPVDSTAITKAISDVIFGKLFVNSKYRYGKSDFPFNKKLDETNESPQTQMSQITLHFITTNSETYSDEDSNFIMISDQQNEVIVVLDGDNEYAKNDYSKEIEEAVQIRNYVKSRNVAQLPEEIQRIIREKQSQASEHEKRAEDLIKKSISNGRIYVAGDKITLKNSSIKERIDKAMDTLIESVYAKFGNINKNYDSDSDIINILKNNKINVEDKELPNYDAIHELLSYLNLQKTKGLPTSMGDIQKRYQGIPYGWREIDIAAITAVLIAAQKLQLKYCGAIIQPSDSSMPEYLRKKDEIDKSIINFRIAPPIELIRKCRKFLSEYYDCTIGAIPDDEDGLIKYIIENFSSDRDEYNKTLSQKYGENNYPGKNIVENGVKLCNDLLKQKNDNTALLKQVVKMQDDFLDFSEDIRDVNNFFDSEQRTIFDSAIKEVKRVNSEKDYFQMENEAQSAIAKIKEILDMANPYNRINELPEYIQKIDDIYNKLLAQKRDEVKSDIQAAMGEIHQTGDIKQADIIKHADEELTEKRKEAERSENLTSLDAMKIKIANIRQKYLKRLTVATEPNVNTVTINRGNICPVTKLKNEEDVDKYVAEIKKLLMKKLDDHDVLNII